MTEVTLLNIVQHVCSFFVVLTVSVASVVLGPTHARDAISAVVRKGNIRAVQAQAVRAVVQVISRTAAVARVPVAPSVVVAVVACVLLGVVAVFVFVSCAFIRFQPWDWIELEGEEPS